MDSTSPANANVVAHTSDFVVSSFLTMFALVERMPLLPKLGLGHWPHATGGRDGSGERTSVGKGSYPG